MPYLIALLGMISAIVFWYYRLRDTSQGVMDMANDVRLAARRFGFQRRQNTHPVESIDDARLAASAIMIIAAESDGAISEAEQKTFLLQCQSVFQCSAEEAGEFFIFGRWIANVSPVRDDTLRRLVRKTLQLGGAEALSDLGGMVLAIGEADHGAADDFVNEVLDRLKRASN